MISGAKRIFSGKFLKRCFHTTTRQGTKTVEEIKIPVPWGHLAGKWWGKKNIQPILAIHGQQENAGSWDPLCELLPSDFSVLAVDLPGHGRSSHLPPFQNYYYNDGIGVLRKIKKHFGMKNIDILAHSEGAAISFGYATIFTEDVRSLFAVDYIVSCYQNEIDRALSLGVLIDDKIKFCLRDQNFSKTHSWEEMKNIMIKAFPFSLNEKSAEILMKRGVDLMPDGKYSYSRDQRMKAYDTHVYTPEQTLRLMENIKCHIRLVKGTRCQLFDVGISKCPGILRIIEKRAKSYKLYELDGNHHLHMDMPEKILPLLLEVLEYKQEGI